MNVGVEESTRLACFACLFKETNFNVKLKKKENWKFRGGEGEEGRVECLVRRTTIKFGTLDLMISSTICVSCVADVCSFLCETCVLVGLAQVLGLIALVRLKGGKASSLTQYYVLRPHSSMS